MANSLYGLGRQKFGAGSIAWGSDTIKVDLVSSSYSPAINSDEFHSTVTGSGGIVAAGVALSSKTNVLGSLGAANTIWSSVSGSAANAIVIWKDTGTDATSPLIGYIDTGSNLPVTPNGSDITAAWAGGIIVTLFESLSEKERKRLARLLGRRWVRKLTGLLVPPPSIIQGPPRLVTA